MKIFDDHDVVLKHTLPVRLFHWCLVLGFLPAGITGIVLFFRPFGQEGMHFVMQIHIVGAWLLTLACICFFIFQPKRVAAFWREIFSWTKRDIDWMKVSGGYPQKIFLGKEISVPLMRKMNSGQKLMGIFVFFGAVIIIVTGGILYVALPLVPKETAWYVDKIHLVVGICLLGAVCDGHIPLGMYNWQEFICMFGDGTIKVKDAAKHNKLWVEEDIEKVK
ncbi:MAG: cytochrome b/b6 domain-containing protein [Selenomonadaceae bacterium]